jgi:hypothetical protein
MFGISKGFELIGKHVFLLLALAASLITLTASEVKGADSQKGIPQFTFHQHDSTEELFTFPAFSLAGYAGLTNGMTKVQLRILVEGENLNYQEKIVFDGVALPVSWPGEYVSENMRLLISTSATQDAWELKTAPFIASNQELIELVRSAAYRFSQSESTLVQPRKISLSIELLTQIGDSVQVGHQKLNESTVVISNPGNSAPSIQGIGGSVRASDLTVDCPASLLPELRLDDSDSPNWERGYIQLLVAPKTNTKTTKPGGWVFDGETVVVGDDGFPGSGEALQVSGVTVGEVMDSGWVTDVSNPEQLRIQLNAKATPELVQRALRSLYFVAPEFDWETRFPVYDKESPFFVLMQLSDGDSIDTAIAEFTIVRLADAGLLASD